MSIITNYDFNGINVEDATIRVDRLWGSSKEGWTALVRVYTTVKVNIPAVKEVTEQRLVSEAIEATDDFEAVEAVYETVVVTEAVEAYVKEELRQIQEFNHSCTYNADERGYESMYKSLEEKFGGESI